MDNLLTEFNILHPRLTFTAEFGQNHKTHLLDITVIRHTNHTEFTICIKSTTTDCTIPKDSCQPIKHKLAAARYLINNINIFPLPPPKAQSLAVQSSLHPYSISPHGLIFCTVDRDSSFSANLVIMHQTVLRCISEDSNLNEQYSVKSVVKPVNMLKQGNSHKLLVKEACRMK